MAKNEWSIDKGQLFLHCRSCLEKKPDGISPKDYSQLEACSHPYTYEDGHTENVIALFCKRCGLLVWSSAHLMQRMEPRTLCVEVRGGVVQDVHGLPPGWDYELADYDDEDDDEERETSNDEAIRRAQSLNG